MRSGWVVPFSSGGGVGPSLRLGYFRFAPIARFPTTEKENPPRRARRVVVRESSPSTPLKVVDPSGAARRRLGLRNRLANGSAFRFPAPKSECDARPNLGAECPSHPPSPLAVVRLLSPSPYVPRLPFSVLTRVALRRGFPFDLEAELRQQLDRLTETPRHPPPPPLPAHGKRRDVSPQPSSLRHISIFLRARRRARCDHGARAPSSLLQ